MKLFLLHIIVVLVGMLMLTGEGQRQLTPPASTETVDENTQLTTKLSADLHKANWLRNYLLMMKVLNPAKQLDLPGDYEKCWNNVPCKVLPWVQQAAARSSLKVCYSTKYLRLLSERHSDGFYLYFLRKLLI